jgi:hypothetical protein
LPGPDSSSAKSAYRCGLPRVECGHTGGLDAALNLAEAHHAEVAILLPLPRNAVHHPVIPLAATSSERTMVSIKTTETRAAPRENNQQPTCNLHSKICMLEW